MLTLSLVVIVFQIEVTSLEPITMAWGVMVLACGLAARIGASFLAVGFGANNPR